MLLDGRTATSACLERSAISRLRQQSGHAIGTRPTARDLATSNPYRFRGERDYLPCAYQTQGAFVIKEFP